VPIKIQPKSNINHYVPMPHAPSAPRHLLIYTDDPGQGGVAQYNHAIALGLHERGDIVTVAQSYADTPLVAERERHGVRHQWLRFDTGQNFSRTVYDGSDAERIFRKSQPDLILFSDSCPVSNLAARYQAMRLGIPFVMVEGFVAPDVTHHFGAGIMANHCLTALETHWQMAQAVVAVSQENLELLHQQYRLPATQGQVIHYGRPDAFFAPPDAATRARLRQEVGIPDSAVLCLTAARLEPVKGHRHLLGAIAHLQQTPVWEHLHFVWAGDGRLRGELEQQIADMGVGDRVHLLGQRWDISDWFDAADVFILPSQVEGMPLSIMEAMAKGLLVMASEVSGIPEELGETGILLTSPAKDAAATVQDLVQAITRWAEDGEGRSHQAAASRQRAHDLFRQDRMVRDTFQVLDSALENALGLVPPDPQATLDRIQPPMHALERGFFPPHDYISPGLHLVKPDAAFPFMSVGDPQACPWLYLRRDIGHNWYVDRRHPFVGFLSRDEAHLLYNLALPFRGKRALEIGCWMGWSACHLALAEVVLDVIDPMLGEWAFYESVRQSLAAAGVGDRVSLIPGYSPQAVSDLATAEHRQWSLLFIDGDHETVGPLLDAIACEPLATAAALVVFHDLASPHVAEGLEYFRRKGWHTQIYQTMQIMGVAWRGQVQPITHQPDPRIAWSLPAHLQHFAVSGLPDHQPTPPPLEWTLAEAEQVPRIQQLLDEAHYARALHLTTIALEADPTSPQLAALRQQILVASHPTQTLPARLAVPTPPSASPTERYPLQAHNLIAFPDWSQPEEVLFADLVTLLQTVLTDPERDRTTLLIYTGATDPEEADMALSSVALHLLTEAGVALDEGTEIALVPPMEPEEWRSLLPHIHQHLPLPHEDAEGMAIAKNLLSLNL